MANTEEKHACLIYVAATAGLRADTLRRLEEAGYIVCEVGAELDAAMAASTGHGSLPKDLAECIQASELCVFLLPEEASQDGGLENAGAVADAQGKRILGIVAGSRAEYPQVFDENAESMIRNESPNLPDTIEGSPVWERPDGARSADREIVRVRCQ